MKSKLGIIGGSGLYNIPALEDAHWIHIQSPWGEPSDDILTGVLHGLPVAFLPRHGRGHRVSPSDINYRANIDALKRLGVTDIISFSACGSLREDLAQGQFALPDQFIDRTRLRFNSFFGAGCVAHVSIAQPVSPGLSSMVANTAREIEMPIHEGGTYLVMEGPQFSTLAESRLYRSWNCDVIGMTNMPEAKLAREAEMCYCTVAMVTDYDCWHPDHGEVDVTKVIETLTGNVKKAAQLIEAIAKAFPKDHPPCPIGSDKALENAIMTAPDARDPALMRKLEAIVARVVQDKTQK